MKQHKSDIPASSLRSHIRLASASRFPASVNTCKLKGGIFPSGLILTKQPMFTLMSSGRSLKAGRTDSKTVSFLGHRVPELIKNVNYVQMHIPSKSFDYSTQYYLFLLYCFTILFFFYSISYCFINFNLFH